MPPAAWSPAYGGATARRRRARKQSDRSPRPTAQVASAACLPMTIGSTSPATAGRTAALAAGRMPPKPRRSFGEGGSAGLPCAVILPAKLEERCTRQRPGQSGSRASETKVTPLALSGVDEVQ